MIADYRVLLCTIAVFNYTLAICPAICLFAPDGPFAVEQAAHDHGSHDHDHSAPQPDEDRGDDDSECCDDQPPSQLALPAVELLVDPDSAATPVTGLPDGKHLRPAIQARQHFCSRGHPPGAPAPPSFLLNCTIVR